MITLEKIFNFYLNKDRKFKPFIIFIIDFNIIFFCLLIVFQINEIVALLNFNFNYLFTLDFLVIIFSCTFLHIIFFYYFRIYLEYARFVSNKTYLNIIKANTLVFITLNLLSNFNFNNTFFYDLNLNFLYFLLSTSIMIAFRSLAKDIYTNYKNNINKIPPSALVIDSVKIEENINLINKFNVKIIICPEIEFNGFLISGIKMIKLSDSYLLRENIISNYNVLIIHNEEIIKKNKDIINDLKKYFKNVRLLNSIKGEINYFDITKKEENDLVKNQDLIFKNKNVLITGGAGSIGKELAKLVIKQNINKLLIVDNSEYNLYKVKNDKLFKNFKNIEFILLDVCDNYALNNLFKENKIDITYHVAAYKHVTVIESQVYSAIKNNIIATNNILELALKNKIEKFIFVSTDKAVKPINVLGYTKRFGELMTLYYDNLSKISNINTSFNCVRFGNVFGSSGSVIPHFENEIKNHRNLKITHLEVSRYYMSINEAASLVILASNLKLTGEIIVFDMGKPIKIIDIAKNLIEFHKKSENKFIPDIEVTNLDPSEKLHEDLFYKSTAKTKYHKIELETQKIKDFDFLISQKKLIDKFMVNEGKYEENLLKFIKDTAVFYNKF